MITTSEIEYNDENTLCRGFIAYEDSVLHSRPCVMIAHDWVGRSKGVCDKAIQLASMGYVGFAIDMYGGARLGNDKAERRALMAPLMQDRNKLLARIRAALNALNQLSFIDKNKIGAIGYCFGGLCVLDLARSGADVKGAVSFHGLLSAPEGIIRTSINAKILILHGYEDPLVKPEQITLFAQEMDQRRVDWQVHMYGHTQHSFTNPEANDDEMGLHYNECADHRSWQSTLDFLSEVLS